MIARSSTFPIIWKSKFTALVDDPPNATPEDLEANFDYECSDGECTIGNIARVGGCSGSLVCTDYPDKCGVVTAAHCLTYKKYKLKKINSVSVKLGLEYQPNGFDDIGYNYYVVNSDDFDIHPDWDYSNGISWEDVPHDIAIIKWKPEFPTYTPRNYNGGPGFKLSKERN